MAKPIPLEAPVITMTWRSMDLRERAMERISLGRIRGRAIRAMAVPISRHRSGREQPVFIAKNPWNRGAFRRCGAFEVRNCARDSSQNRDRHPRAENAAGSASEQEARA
ncbi:MAG TPA: hypothetical protein VM509_00265 [Planctomycetota bacterium]|nr:hypothetical protein [Planctomycetota bacterium]